MLHLHPPTERKKNPEYILFSSAHGIFSGLTTYYGTKWAFQEALVVNNPPANAADVGLIPGLGRHPGEGNGNPL